MESEEDCPLAAERAEALETPGSAARGIDSRRHMDQGSSGYSSALVHMLICCRRAATSSGLSVAPGTRNSNGETWSPQRAK